MIAEHEFSVLGLRDCGRVGASRFDYISSVNELDSRSVEKKLIWGGYLWVFADDSFIRFSGEAFTYGESTKILDVEG